MRLSTFISKVSLVMLLPLAGEISEGFNPTRGENTDSVSSPGPASPRPGPAGPPPALTVPVLMNDSDDSL